VDALYILLWNNDSFYFEDNRNPLARAFAALEGGGAKAYETV